MLQQPAHSIIAELEDAVRGGSSAKRVETLWLLRGRAEA